MNRYTISITTLFVLLLVCGTANASCVNRKKITIWKNNYQQVTRYCEKCFGDVVNNNPATSDFCPGSTHADFGKNLCPGHCSVSNDECEQDSDCPAGETCLNDGDPFVTSCYGSSDDVINGTANDDSIDGGGGDDVIYGKGGNDELSGGAGNDRIYGGSGDDLLNGGPYSASSPDESGDDQIYGEGDDDVLLGNGGRDYLHGGSGDDYVLTVTTGIYGSLAAPDDVVGSLLCGGGGDDLVWATGNGYHCLDGGGDSGDGCFYQYKVGGAPTPTIADGATARRCASCLHILPVGGEWFACTTPMNTHAPCGCDP